jgi:hypothetical protein
MASMDIATAGGAIQGVQCGAETYRFDSFRDGWLWSAGEVEGLGATLPGQPDGLRLFNYSRGGIVSHTDGLTPRQADDRDTDMPQPNYMNADQEMWVACLYPEVLALTNATNAASGGASNISAFAPIPSANTLKFLEYNCCIQLFLGVQTEKTYMEAPFGYFASAADAMYCGSGDSPGGPQINVGSLTFAGGSAARTGDRLFHLAAKDRIEVRLQFPKGGTAIAAGTNSLAYTMEQNVRIRTYLRGPRAFPVQGGSAQG